ncbi:uncharacterized protein LOC126734911 [Anthonomus grandis grandis]|uniref:uncharacterized protein LOC126734911 n=1 Tax=Anthonomus grandis grandis TaxID=2921223 RepID=UPI00216576B3|nr:uncharacterized protein LOC126734911 [Anthonomus grandis grandis]
MNSLGLAVFLVTVAIASAGLHAGIVGGVGSPAIISGPSGAVVRSGVAHGAVVAGPALGLGLGLGHLGVVAPGVLAPGLGLLGAHGWEGSGIEGQWIPDINEHLYDDGSYKPHIYGH